MEEQKGLVSIILNCYNGEKYLRYALDTVIEQNYNNWELIFWDNQSTDNSKKFLTPINQKNLDIFIQTSYNPL